MKDKNNDNSVVVMDNRMVKAKFGKLTDVESRFIFFAISQINYNDTEFRNLRFNMGTLLKALGVPGKNYTYLLKVLKKVVGKLISVPDKNGITVFPWFQMGRVEKSEMVEVQFNELLKPYLLQLRQNFTKAELTQLIGMKNHTRRIYLMCKQWLNVGYFEKDIAAIREELELGVMYKQYKYMTRDLLTPAFEEINKLSDIRVSFKPIRTGSRAYTKLGINVWSAPTVAKITDKKNAVAEKNRRIIEDKRKEADVARAEKLRQHSLADLESAKREWEETCKMAEIYLTRKSDSWQKCLETIKTLVSENQFEMWFAATEMFVDGDNNAYILVPNNFAMNMMIGVGCLNHVMKSITENNIKVATVQLATIKAVKERFDPVVVNQSIEMDGVNEADIVEEDSNQTSLFQNSEQVSLFN